MSAAVILRTPHRKKKTLVLGITKLLAETEIPFLLLILFNFVWLTYSDKNKLTCEMVV
jgi:hypothetical protein